MKSRLLAAVLMMFSFGAVAPAAAVVSRPVVAVRVAPVVVYSGPRYYVAPMYPAYPVYGYRVYGGYRYGYGYRAYGYRAYGYRGYRR